MPEQPQKSDPPSDPDNEPTGRYPISLLRKILLLIFVVGFWIFYFWYNTNETQTDPSPPAPIESKESPQQETPLSNEKEATEGK